MLQENLTIDKTNWTPVKFGDVVFEPKESTNNPIDDGILHVVGLEHIETENIHLRKSASIEEATTFTKKFTKNDVLFGRRRAYLKKAAQASFGGICSGDITVFRAKENLMPELLPFIVNNEKFFDYAIKHSAGGLSPRVKFKDLANYEFLLPPKHQQAELAKLFWAMDDVIEGELGVLLDVENLIKTLQKSVYNKENYPRFKLSHYASILGGYAFTSKSFINKGIPVVKIKNIVNGNIIVNDDSNYIASDDVSNIHKYVLSQGDILIAMTGATLGKVGVVQKEYDGALLNQRVGKFQFKKEVDVWFMKGILDSNYFLNELNKYIGEGAQGNISSEDISKTQVPDLTIIEMKQLGREFMALYSSADSLESKANNSKSLQKSLINQVF